MQYTLLIVPSDETHLKTKLETFHLTIQMQVTHFVQDSLLRAIVILLLQWITH